MISSYFLRNNVSNDFAICSNVKKNLLHKNVWGIDTNPNLKVNDRNILQIAFYKFVHREY